MTPVSEWMAYVHRVHEIARPIVGDHFRALRIRRGMNKTQAAAFTKLARRNYARLEMGKHLPDMVTIITLTKLLDIEGGNALAVLVTKIEQAIQEVV